MVTGVFSRPWSDSLGFLPVVVVTSELRLRFSDCIAENSVWSSGTTLQHVLADRSGTKAPDCESTSGYICAASLPVFFGQELVSNPALAHVFKLALGYYFAAVRAFRRKFFQQHFSPQSFQGFRVVVCRHVVAECCSSSSGFASSKRVCSQSFTAGLVFSSAWSSRCPFLVADSLYIQLPVRWGYLVDRSGDVPGALQRCSPKFLVSYTWTIGFLRRIALYVQLVADIFFWHRSLCWSGTVSIMVWLRAPRR